ncbi:UBC4-like protein, partial [Penicillium atrosanguineum]
AESPYDNGIFYLSLWFPSEYPYKPPKIAFTTKVYHPNIGAKGNIGLDMIGDNWGSGLTLNKGFFCPSLYCSNPPNLDDSLEPEIARIYKTDRNLYEATAREWSTKFAR